MPKRRNMKLKAAILRTSILPLVMLAVCATAIAQLNRRSFLSDEGPTSPSAYVVSPGAIMKRMYTHTPNHENGLGEEQRYSARDALPARQGFEQATPNSMTIPHWQESVTYHWPTYAFTTLG